MSLFFPLPIKLPRSVVIPSLSTTDRLSHPALADASDYQNRLRLPTSHATTIEQAVRRRVETYGTGMLVLLEIPYESPIQLFQGEGRRAAVTAARRESYRWCYEHAPWCQDVYVAVKIMNFGRLYTVMLMAKSEISGHISQGGFCPIEDHDLVVGRSTCGVEITTQREIELAIRMLGMFPDSRLYRRDERDPDRLALLNDIVIEQGFGPGRSSRFRACATRLQFTFPKDWPREVPAESPTTPLPRRNWLWEPGFGFEDEFRDGRDEYDELL